MRPLRLTKVEHAEMTHLVQAAHAAEPDKVYDGLLKKLAEMVAAAPGVAAGPIEEALLSSSRGKVVQLAGGSAYARCSKQATSLGVTVDDARLVGSWLARQGWFQGPTTLLGVLNKWAEWLPRARATAPPPKASEGFGDETGESTDGAQREGGGGSGRSRPQGFR